MLPCNHRFHTECIDQWLSSRKPLCPVCKHDALTPFGIEESEPQAQEETEALEEGSRPELSLPPFFFPIRRCKSTPSTFSILVVIFDACVQACCNRVFLHAYHWGMTQFHSNLSCFAFEHHLAVAFSNLLSMPSTQQSGFLQLDLLSCACRWRRRWQWGPGPSHPQATTGPAESTTAPVDIEQPAIQTQQTPQHGLGASSSSSQFLAANEPAAGTTPVNFPGMHYSRSGPSRLSAAVSTCCSGSVLNACSLNSH